MWLILYFYCTALLYRGKKRVEIELKDRSSITKWKQPSPGGSRTLGMEHEQDQET